MKRRLIRLLLRLLNTQFLNPTPCRYGHINNLDAFSRDNLESEERQRPGIMVSTILAEAALFRQCGVRNSFTVIENGVPREGTIFDIHELHEALATVRGEPRSIDICGRQYWGCNFCLDLMGVDDPRVQMFATHDECARHIAYDHMNVSKRDV